MELESYFYREVIKEGPFSLSKWTAHGTTWEKSRRQGPDTRMSLACPADGKEADMPGAVVSGGKDSAEVGLLAVPDHQGLIDEEFGFFIHIGGSHWEGHDLIYAFERPL